MRTRGRGSQMRPSSSRGARSPRAATKIQYNCIIDDTSIIEDISKTGGRTLTSWALTDLVKIYVPQYTLDMLNVSKLGSDDDDKRKAEIAVQWLDEITNKRPNNVVIQEEHQLFDDSIEIEKYKTRKVLSNQGANREPRTPPQSPPQYARVISSDNILTQVGALDLTAGDEPVQPFPTLFNHIIWRVYKDPASSSDISTYKLVTSDSQKAAVASSFGLSTKSLEQMDQTIQDAMNQDDAKLKTPDSSQELPVQNDSDSEEEILLKRGTSPPPQSRPLTQQSPRTVMDPNDFGRRSVRGGNRLGRGGHRPTNSREKIQVPPRTPATETPEVIDPDSFARPKPSRGRGRGRLWEPS